MMESRRSKWYLPRYCFLPVSPLRNQNPILGGVVELGRKTYYNGWSSAICLLEL
nr:hypothetical protein Q903MT_gene2636 [Picea sitchensis]